MMRSKKLLSVLAALAFLSAVVGCKVTGMHLKEKYPADRLIVASAGDVPVIDAAAGLAVEEEAPSHSASIDQLLCAHGFAAHHPYRYLNNCARSGRI
jgi:hypothetical protein